MDWFGIPCFGNLEQFAVNLAELLWEGITTAEPIDIVNRGE
jgi:hypothetical protein